jgi:DNA-binding CsgD family transcriptional regulator
MKKEIHIRNYYQEYLEVCRSISAKSELVAFQKLVKGDNVLSDFRSPMGICLIDYSKRKYEYLSDYSQEIVGHSRDNYISGGTEFHNGVWLTEDKVIFEKQLFRDIQEFWSRISPDEIPKYRFSFCYRYFRDDGTVSHLLQHCNYHESQGGQPVLNLSLFSDISEYKTDNTMVLTISYLDSQKGYVKVFSKTYLPVKKTPLSSRESEVLKLCLEGNSSKMIAEKLFLSIQTVKNHKRNMMDKTSAKNIAELISLCLLNSWI